MGVGSEGETRKNSSGGGQAIAFILVALAVGVLSLCLAGLSGGYVAFLLFGFLFVVFFAGDKRRLFLVIYLFLAIWLLVGSLTHFWLSGEETVAQVSDWPLIGSLLERAAVRTVVAILAGGVSAALGVGLPLLFIILVSAEWVLALRETHELDRKLAIKLLFYLAMGIGEVYMIADGGEIKETKPQGPLKNFGAPAVVVVKPYNAVVLEQGGKITRIEGSGVVTLQKQEGVKAVIDLRPQSAGFETDVRTKDNVPLTVKGGVGFRIESQDETRKRGGGRNTEIRGFSGVISGPYPVYRRTIYRAVFNVEASKDWFEKTKGTAGSKVRARVREREMKEIFPIGQVDGEQSILNELAAEALELARDAAVKWGVTIYGISVNEIEMPEEVKQRFIEHLEAEWQGHTEIIRAESDKVAKIIRAEGESEATLRIADAERQAIRSFESVKVKAIEAFVDQIQRVVDADDLKDPQVAARFIAALERLSRSMVADDRSAMRLTEALERLVLSQPPGPPPLLSTHSRFSKEESQE